MPDPTDKHSTQAQGTKGGATATEEPPPPLTGPQPQPPTPLDPPQVFYNTKWRVPPLLVTTQEAADALDPDEWTPDPSSPAAKGKGEPPSTPHYPKLFANINLPPVIVADAEAARALGDSYREVAIPDALAKSAEQTNADHTKAAEAKAKQQKQGGEQPAPHKRQ